MEGMCRAEGSARTFAASGDFFGEQTLQQNTHPSVAASTNPPGLQGAEQSSFYHSKHSV